MKKNIKQGFSIVEMLVVVVILVVAGVIIIQALSRYGRQQSLVLATEKVASIITDARSRTLASENSKQYGVHFDTFQVVLFGSVTYSPSDSDNEVTNLDSRVRIATTSLSGGGSDVLFERLTGKTTGDGTIILELLADPSKTQTISIQPTGIISITTQ